MRLERLRVLLLPLVLAVSAVRAHAQSTEQDIFARLQDQPLFLRGFPLDDKLKFNSDGRPAKVYIPVSFKLSGFRADAVRLYGNHMHIEGVRVGLLFDEQGTPHRTVLTTGGLLSRAEAVTVDVDIASQPDITRLLNAIFVNGFAELAPTLPDFWQRYMRRQNTGDDSSTTSAGDVDGPVLHVDSSIQPPKLLRSPPPRYSDFANRTRLSGHVQIYLVIEPDGMPSHIQIVRPFGLGQDEAAVAAVIGYRFSPATQNGKPVKVDLYVEINF